MSYNEMKDSNNVYDNFLTVVPKDKKYLDYMVDPIRLNVISNDGVNYTPDLNIKVNDLNNGKKYFLNNSGDGDKFKNNVIFKSDEKSLVMDFLGYAGVKYSAKTGEVVERFDPQWNYRGTKLPVITMLDYWMRNMTVFIVTTRAMDIPNGEYIITGNPSRKQTYESSTVWELEFTRYTGVTAIGFKAVTNSADKAVKKYNANKKKSNKTTKAKKASSSNNKFSKCKLSVLVYSKKQKKVDCVKQLQTILKKQKFYNSTIDGWYYTKTAEAVKQFQKKYKSKYNLSVTGKVDKKTFNALCKV